MNYHYIDYENLVNDLIEDGWSDQDAREYLDEWFNDQD